MRETMPTTPEPPPEPTQAIEPRVDTTLDLPQQLGETLLLAMNPDELQASHKVAREWADSMAKLMLNQAEEFGRSLEMALRQGWRSGGLERACNMAKRRHDFYIKIVQALDAGYLMVPNFEMTAWVVRTDRKKPKGNTRTERWGYSRWFPQEARQLPAGEGRYVARDAKSDVATVKRNDDKGNVYDVYQAWPTEFDDAPPFPFVFATPCVMERTSQALEERVFDEIGVSDDGGGGRRGDPMLLGRVLNPRPNHPDMTFFLAWAMDLRRV